MFRSIKSRLTATFVILMVCFICIVVSFYFYDHTIQGHLIKDAILGVEILYYKIFFYGVMTLAIGINALFLLNATKKLGTPLKKLSESVKQVVQSNFEETTLLYKSKRKDEVGGLSRDFEFMMGKLHHWTKELKKAKVISEKQKERIESSIRYAQTIQSASLPDVKLLSQHFQSFLLYKPKDIVSGDFYWYHYDQGDYKQLEKIIYAVVDCTGHGVPGAFMSMIGVQLLNEIIIVNRVYDPGKILTQLNEKVRNTLHQNDSDNEDGMDVCLCILERTGNYKTRLTYAGAERPLYIYKCDSGDVEEIKENRKTIGGWIAGLNQEPFTNETRMLDSGDVIYLTSDGYTDQNNNMRKRFGRKRFSELIKDIGSESVEIQKKELLNKLEEFQGPEAQRDDISILGIQIS